MMFRIGHKCNFGASLYKTGLVDLYCLFPMNYETSVISKEFNTGIYKKNNESIVINQEELLQACKNYVGKFDDNIRVKHPIIIEGHINGSNCLKEIILPDSFHESTSEVIYIRLEDMEKAFKSANSSILLCEKKIDGIQVLVVNQDCED